MRSGVLLTCGVEAGQYFGEGARSTQTVGRGPVGAVSAFGAAPRSLRDIRNPTIASPERQCSRLAIDRMQMWHQMMIWPTGSKVGIPNPRAVYVLLGERVASTQRCGHLLGPADWLLINASLGYLDALSEVRRSVRPGNDLKRCRAELPQEVIAVADHRAVGSRRRVGPRCGAAWLGTLFDGFAPKWAALCNNDLGGLTHEVKGDFELC